MEKIKQLQKERGITLIALIITVIVMLILAGIAINLSIGDNGIFKKTQETREISKQVAIKEDLELKISDMEMEKLMKGQTLTKEELVEKLPSIGMVVIDHTEGKIEGEYENYQITIDENNKVTIGVELIGAKPEAEVNVTPLTANVEKVELQVIASIAEGEIASIESMNGLTLKAGSNNIYEVNKNGKYKFKVTGSNGRIAIIEEEVSNIIEYSNILTEIAKIESAGKQEIKVTGRTSAGEIETITYPLNVLMHKGNLVLNGETGLEGATVSDKVYTLGDRNDVAQSTSVLAKNTVVLKVEGDLTIEEGVTLKAVESSAGLGGPKGMVIYCTGTLTNNGQISMSQNGAYANGENVYLWCNEGAAGNNAVFEYVPKDGKAGATANSTPEGTYRYVNPNANAHGTGRQTAGGASGGAAKIGWVTVKGGNGGQGTSYSGGRRRRWYCYKRPISRTRKKWKLLYRRNRSKIRRRKLQWNWI